MTYLNKLRIVENTPRYEQNQNIMSMSKAKGPIGDSWAPAARLSGPRLDVPAEPPSHRHCQQPLFS
jgi:hypothetical protein